MAEKQALEERGRDPFLAKEEVLGKKPSIWEPERRMEMQINSSVTGPPPLFVVVASFLKNPVPKVGG